jgi:hypothetical protein
MTTPRPKLTPEWIRTAVTGTLMPNWCRTAMHAAADRIEELEEALTTARRQSWEEATRFIENIDDVPHDIRAHIAQSMRLRAKR